METLHGIAAAPGVAIASAARLHEEYGVPSLSPDRLRRIGARLTGFGVENPEPEQIILIGDRLPPGIWLSPLPGVQVVGLAAGVGASLSPAPDRPAVLGLGETLLQTVQEDDIVIVDGDRGRVYVAPDAATVARYQAPFALARRFFLEGAHLPARTASDNRLVSVLCYARTWADVDEAMRQGADGLVIAQGCDFLGAAAPAQTAGEQAQTLGDLAQTAGGQPLWLDLPHDDLALSALCRGAARLPLHLVLRDPAERDELRERLDAMETALEEDDVLFGRVGLDAGITGESESDDLPDSLAGFAGVFVRGSVVRASWERLLLLSGAARQANLPVTAALDGDWWPHVLGDALGMGFSRLVVPAPAVADVKDAVREL